MRSAVPQPRERGAGTGRAAAAAGSDGNASVPGDASVLGRRWSPGQGGGKGSCGPSSSARQRGHGANPKERGFPPNCKSLYGGSGGAGTLRPVLSRTRPAGAAGPSDTGQPSRACCLLPNLLLRRNLSLAGVSSKISINQRRATVGFAQTPTWFLTQPACCCLRASSRHLRNTRNPAQTAASAEAGPGWPCAAAGSPAGATDKRRAPAAAARHPQRRGCRPAGRGFALQPGRLMCSLGTSGFPRVGTDSRAGGDGPRQH